jgi:quinol monooxygenase YgiN
MAIGALVTLRPKPGAAAELLEKTVEVIADVRTEPGNLMSVTLRDPDQPEKIFLFEIYRDQDAIAAQGGRPFGREGPRSPCAVRRAATHPMVRDGRLAGRPEIIIREEVADAEYCQEADRL